MSFCVYVPSYVLCLASYELKDLENNMVIRRFFFSLILIKYLIFMIKKHISLSVKSIDILCGISTPFTKTAKSPSKYNNIAHLSLIGTSDQVISSPDTIYTVTSRCSLTMP